MQPIAIDIMSGDREPREYLAGAVRALTEDGGLHAFIVGDAALLNGTIPAALRERVELIGTTQVVAMDDSPREAIRRNKDSPMRRAVDLGHE